MGNKLSEITDDKECKSRQNRKYTLKGGIMLFHTLVSIDRPEIIRYAFKFAMERAINHTSEMAIAGHTKAVLDGELKNVYGSQFLKPLKRANGTINFNGIKTHFISERSISEFRRGIIIAPFISLKFLNELEKDSRCIDLIYLPWMKRELDEYMLSHDSELISLEVVNPQTSESNEDDAESLGTQDSESS